MELKSRVFSTKPRLSRCAAALLFTLTVFPPNSPAQQTNTSKNPQQTGSDIVIEYTETVATASGAQNVRMAHVLKPDPNDPDHAFDPATGRNFNWDPDKKAWVNSETGNVVVFDGYLVTSAPPPSAPPNTTAAGTAPSNPPPKNNNPVSMSGFTPAIQLRGFGGASFINGNTPATAGFDGAVLFPLGNRVLVGPTAGFQWVDSSIVKTIGGGPPPSTFINTSVGFKSGNFGGRIAFPFGGWQLGIQGGATVAASTITQATGLCGGTGGSLPPGCTVTSTSTTQDTVVGPLVGAYVSRNIFSRVGVFFEYDYHLLKDTQPNPTNPSGPSVTVFDLHYSDVVAGLVLTFGRH